MTSTGRLRYRLATLTAATAALTAAAVLAPTAPAVPALTAPAAAATACPTPKTSPLKAVPATQAKNVSLTFDDGPSPYTGKILDVLKAKGVKATFFVTGQKVAANPAMAQRIVREGHVIANHTWSHPQNVAGSSPRGSFDKLSSTVMIDQLNRTSNEIRRVTGVTPCFFRAPGGHHFGSTSIKLVRARGMSVVHWSHETRDWAQPGKANTAFTNSIVANATRAHAHPIVLMHDGKASPEPESKVSSYRGNTLAALPRIVDYYKARGYTFTDPAGRKLAVAAAKPATVKVTLAASAKSVRVNRGVTLRGKATGAKVGTPVAVQVISGGKWVTVRSTKLVSGSAYAATDVPKWKGKRSYRALVAGKASPTVTITVT